MTPEWHYVFEIADVRPYYSFGVDTFSPESFREHHVPTLDAACLFPKKYAGRMVEFTVIGARDALERKPNGFGVGRLKMRGKVSEFLGWVPSDMLHSLLMMAATKQYRFINLSGPPLFRGDAEIKSIAFDSVCDLSQLARDFPELA